jgi:small subunit ribosomal protein S5
MELEQEDFNSKYMEPTQTTTPEVKPVAPVAAAPAPRSASTSNAPMNRRPRRGGPREQKERVKPEFDTKIISIRRVTRVASGGRRFSFSVALVAGDRKGRVGVGLGKAGDTSLAIDKATRDAKKNMIRVAHTSAMSIPHPVEAKYSSARIEIMPAKGRGIVAGSAVRNVVELAGLKDIVAKIRSGSKNKLNIARGAIQALSSITKHPKSYANK